MQNKTKRQNIACKIFCLFVLFYRNANDTEEMRSIFEGERLHGTHSISDVWFQKILLIANAGCQIATLEWLKQKKEWIILGLYKLIV